MPASHTPTLASSIEVKRSDVVVWMCTNACKAHCSCGMREDEVSALASHSQLRCYRRAWRPHSACVTLPACTLLDLPIVWSDFDQQRIRASTGMLQNWHSRRWGCTARTPFNTLATCSSCPNTRRTLISNATVDFLRYPKFLRVYCASGTASAFE